MPAGVFGPSSCCSGKQSPQIGPVRVSCQIQSHRSETMDKLKRAYLKLSGFCGSANDSRALREGRRPEPQPGELVSERCTQNCKVTATTGCTAGRLERFRDRVQASEHTCIRLNVQRRNVGGVPNRAMVNSKGEPHEGTQNCQSWCEGRDSQVGRCGWLCPYACARLGNEPQQWKRC
jgi:hypothetical protein